ncbi:hypothetical protein [Nostoc sp.]
MRGCAFHSDFALVGLSLPSHNKTFNGLALDERYHHYLQRHH